MAITIHNLLSNALLELCESKPLTSITVRELLTKTEVGRNVQSGNRTA